MPYDDGDTVRTEDGRYGTVVGYDPDDATMVGVKWTNGDALGFISESLLEEPDADVLVLYFRLGELIALQGVTEEEVAALDAAADLDPTLIEVPLAQDPEVRAQLRLARGLLEVT